MKRIIYIQLFLLIIFTACENEEIINPESKHIELTVIQAELIPGRQFSGVRITKTLPLGVPFTIEKAEIKNAEVYLIKNGHQVIPLHYQGGGIYFPLYEIYFFEGESYELFGTARGKTFYSSTIIPNEPELTSARYNLNGGFTEAFVSVNENEVYAALWGVDDGAFHKASDFYDVAVPKEFLPTSTSYVRTAVLPSEYQTGNFNGTRLIQVYAFDQSFEKYFNTRDASGEINNPFVQGYRNVEWNIEGTDVIGMFIGFNVGDFIQVQ